MIRERFQKNVGHFLVMPGLLVGLGLLLFAPGCKKAESSKPGAGSATAEQNPPPKKFETGRQVLEAMAAAYHRAKTYSDQGIVRKTLESGGNKSSEKFPFFVELIRPDKLRMGAYQINIVIDGKKFYASMGDYPGQVVIKDAPAKMNMHSIYNDFLLADAVSGPGSVAGPPPQIFFLLEDKPLEILLQNAEEPVLAEPGTVDGRPCYQVQVRFAQGGLATYWIDQETLILRRFNLPTQELRVPETEGGDREPVSLSLVAEFKEARFDAPIPPEAFQFEVPPEAVKMPCFVSAPVQLLGKKVPDFKFVDLEGRPVAPPDLAGKVAVLGMWVQKDPVRRQECLDALTRLQEVSQRFRDSQQVVFYAVNLDDSQVHEAILKAALQQAKIHLPLLRDPNSTAQQLAYVPAVLVIGPDGTLQDFEGGLVPDLAAELPRQIEQLLAGKETAADCLQRIREGVPLPVQVAPRTEPRTLKLVPLWKSAEVKVPGNLLVIQEPNGPPRIVVTEGATHSIAEVGSDGKLLARHPVLLDPEKELVTSLRTSTDARGHRWIAAFASGYQRCFLFDQDWKQVLTFPADALNYPHHGIADVALGDLDGDGTPEMYVGYWGLVGVQAVSLEGKLLWTNRSVSNVLCLGIGPADPHGQRRLICTNSDGALVSLDAQGQRTAETSVPNRPLVYFTGAELEAPGALQWCGLSMPKIGQTVALGLTLSGKELWHYDLPAGIHSEPVEKIVPGRLQPAGPGVWMLPGPDGSIHFLAADGTLRDRFNYGAAIQGLAACEIDGRMALVVATADGLEAWKIEQ